MKISKLVSRVFWGAAGLLIVYIIYTAIVEQIALRKYESLFTQVTHPAGTIQLDTLSFRFSLYPATYVDENIDFVHVYLVGELRGYTGTWEELASYYQQSPGLESGKRVAARPVVIDLSEDNTSWLQFMDGISYNPSDVAVIEAIRDHYGLHGIPDALNNSDQRVYLVYVLWWEGDDGS